MAVKKIVQIGHEALKKVSEAFNEKDDKNAYDFTITVF